MLTQTLIMKQGIGLPPSGDFRKMMGKERKCDRSQERVKEKWLLMQPVSYRRQRGNRRILQEGNLKKVSTAGGEAG